MTRVNNSNICGMSSVVERKSLTSVYPQIGHFFANIPERRAITSPDGDKDRNPLELDLIEEGSRLVSNLKAINLKPQPCYRDNEPINLYHKVGHGTLDMYIISPSKDSKEVKDFLQKWQANDQKLFSPKDSKEFNFPMQNVVSICALLVWQPANPDDNITRILFPGSTPDTKIFEGLEKVKALEFLKHPICSVKTVTPSLSTSILSKKALKAEKILDSSVKSMKEKLSDKKVEAEKKPEADENKTSQPDNRLMEEQANESTIEAKVDKNAIKSVARAKVVAKQIKADVKSAEAKKIEIKKAETEKAVVEKSDKDETEVKPSDEPEVISEEKEVVKKEEVLAVESKPRPKITKPKSEAKTQIKSRIDSKPPKSMDKKSSAKKDDKEQKSSPTTPKKSSDGKLPNGAAVAVKDAPSKEAPIKAKIAPRMMKASPKSTPAKSTKDATNRKVLEARQKPQTSTTTRAVKTEEAKKEVKVIEKKSVAKRTIRKAGSPMKQSRKDTAVKRPGKVEKTETTDSSLVSTPSADDVQKKIIASVEADPSKLKDLQEEQDAVREIEAVFQKEDKRRSHGIILTDHRELHESTTEVEEEEEYLIIEKEEPYTEDSINEVHESQKEEDDAQKQRDSDDSEKKLKDDSKEKEDPMGEDEGGEEEEEKGEDEDGEKGDEDADEDAQPDDGSKDLIKDIKTEVQGILTSATEIAKNKMETSAEGLHKTEELSAPSPDDRLSSTKRTSDTKDDDQKEGTKDGGMENDPIMIESQPEEKFSATSGATTAPTMPEEEVKEGPQLDEIKEDQAVEEKYIKEETKESDLVITKLPTVFEPLKKEDKSGFPGPSSHIRDIVKTPDEVADLPMHEVVDYQGYVEYSGKRAEKSEDSSKVKDEGDQAKEEDEDEGEDKEDVEEKENDEGKEDEEGEDGEEGEEEKEVEAVEAGEEVENLKNEIKTADDKVADDQVEEAGVDAEEDAEANADDNAEENAEEAENNIDEAEVNAEKAEATAEGAEVTDEEAKTTNEEAEADAEKAEATAEEAEVNAEEAEVNAEEAELTAEETKATNEEAEANAKEAGAETAGEPVEKPKPTDGLKTESSEKALNAEEKAQIREITKAFATEIRETHITTVESPLTEDKAEGFGEVKKDAKGYQIEEIKFIPIDESGLNDIKEEDEHGVSPPPKHSLEDVEKLSASPKLPPRARTPEDVMKIVTKVAEVLKTDKDLEEIIPDFDAEELERRLSSKPITDDENETEPEAAPTVQRMLVTASSEDGGMETEICPQGSINFTAASTPEKLKSDSIFSTEKDKQDKDSKTPPSSGKSSPELKTSTFSVEEKEKNELPEKETHLTKSPETLLSKLKKEEDALMELRRESAISMMSEKDYTKDESSIVIEKTQSRSHSITSNILDLEHDETEGDMEKTLQDAEEDSRPASQASVASEKSATIKPVDQTEPETDARKASSASGKQDETPDEQEESETVVDARKASVTSIASEKKSDETKEASRPVSQASHLSGKSESVKPDEPETVVDARKASVTSVASEKKSDETKEDSRPVSQASHVSGKSESGKPDEPETVVDARKASAASVASEKKSDETKEASRPVSQASHLSGKSESGKPDEPEEPETIVDARKASVTSVASEKKSDETKEASRPVSQASHVSGKLAPGKPEDQAKSGTDDRKASIVSVVSLPDGEPVSAVSSRKESLVTTEIDNKLGHLKEDSRPASQASVQSDKSVPGKPLSLVDSRKESIASMTADETKETSRPESQASCKSAGSLNGNDEESSEVRTIVTSTVTTTEVRQSSQGSATTIVSSSTTQESSQISTQDFRESIVQDLSESMNRTECDDDKMPDGGNTETEIEEFVIRRKSSVSVASDHSDHGNFFERPESPLSDGHEIVETEARKASFVLPLLSAAIEKLPESAEQACTFEFDIRRRSSVSAASDRSIHDDFSRPETPLSTGEAEENQDDVTNLVQTIEHQTVKTVQIVDETDDRRESVSKAERLFESRRESNKCVDDSSLAFPICKDFVESDDKIFMKESRSKSVSSVCSTSGRDDFGKLSAIEEILAGSKDDLMVISKTSEETSTQKSDKDSEIVTQTQTIIETITTTSFPIMTEQIKITSSGFPIIEQQEVSSTTKALSEDLTQKLESVKVEASRIVTEVHDFIKIESTDSELQEKLEGQKTPPTVPLSPNVIPQKSSSTEAVKLVDATGKVSGISTPKGSINSGRSSPDSAASKSIALGHGSAVEETPDSSPDSSPKPTSPFPKTIDALKSEDDHKTSSGISTPDMTRTSTPDTTERHVETSSKSTTVKEEISEFKSKVHTQDFTFRTEKESFSDIKSGSGKDSNVESFHSQWTTSYKQDSDDQEQHFAYEGKFAFFPFLPRKAFQIHLNHVANHV